MMMDKSLLLKLELFDGTSQIVQITEEQAAHLGINIAENGPGLIIPATNELQNVQQIAVQDNSLPEGGSINEHEVTANYMYKIIKPEDLDLKPVTTTHLPRGRPRKRPSEQVTQEQSKSFKEPQVVIKQVRTRSGRITKPPRYIGQDFRVINTSDDTKHDTELKTLEYDSLKTSEIYPLEPQLHLEQHSKKRNIPAHYRCPTCKKAYLGKMKMLNHFNKYPDHGPVPNFCKTRHNSTWNFLILTTQKFKDGSKGMKFCQELTVLLENARILAKLLFKPVENGESGYFIDEYLAHIFGIVPGDYILNENELHKDVSLHTFLEKKCKEKKHLDVSNQIRSEEMDVITAKHMNGEFTDTGTHNKLYTSELHGSDKEIHKDIELDTSSNSRKTNDNSQIPTNKVNVTEGSVQNKDKLMCRTNFSPSHVIAIENSLHIPSSHDGNNCDQTFLQENTQLSMNTNSSVSTQKEKHFSNGGHQTYLQENSNSVTTPEKKHFLLANHDGISFGNLNNLESVIDSTERLSDDSINYHTLNIDMKFDGACISLRDVKSIKGPGHKQDVPTDHNDDKSNGYNINKHIMMGNDLLNQVNDLILVQNVSERVNQNPRCISDKKCHDYTTNKHSLGNELLSHVDELMLENVDNTERHKQTSTRTEITKKHQPDIKKSSDYDIEKHIRMHNELLSHVEDLILENIDTGQVSNILETSSNSDDIMNVDQFVNERFKKLTEPDIELQNTSLNLDLPPLDMFNFHTS